MPVLRWKFRSHFPFDRRPFSHCHGPMNTAWSTCLCTAAILATMSLSSLSADSKPDTRCYEMRTYYAAPGKLEALQARFRDHTCKLFEKHGIVNVGYWTPTQNTNNALIYILSYPNREAREASWKAFINDPDWKAAAKASEANGKLVQKVEVKFLSATDYSPAIKPGAGYMKRVFELRTYTATEGKLDRLHARFRDHTLALFSKHGMTHIGYWTPMDKKDGADNLLIYVLAHASQEARDKSFEAFRADPEWVKVKGESEKEGSLTVKVESVMMQSTDYSPIK